MALFRDIFPFFFLQVPSWEEPIKNELPELWRDDSHRNKALERTRDTLAHQGTCAQPPGGNDRTRSRGRQAPARLRQVATRGKGPEGAALQGRRGTVVSKHRNPYVCRSVQNVDGLDRKYNTVSLAQKYSSPCANWLGAVA